MQLQTQAIKITEPVGQETQRDEEFSILGMNKKIYLSLNQLQSIQRHKHKKRQSQIATIIMALVIIVAVIFSVYQVFKHPEQGRHNPISQATSDQKEEMNINRAIKKKQAPIIQKNIQSLPKEGFQKQKNNENAKPQNIKKNINKQQVVQKPLKPKRAQQIKQKRQSQNNKKLNQQNKKVIINKKNTNQAHIKKQQIIEMQTLNQAIKVKIPKTKDIQKINLEDYSKLSTIQQKALKELHPWDLSKEAKDSLLNKYKRMPKRNPQQTEFMPIVQDPEKEILPILEEFQKTNEVVHYSSLPMTEEERKEHEKWFKQKLQERILRTHAKLKQQAAYSTNPDALFTTDEFKITRGQWHSAFEYHALVGVDVSADPAAKKIAEKEAQYFQQKYGVGKYKKELKMCVISPGFNNEAFERYLWNIESVLQQNYTNYKMVIIDDASTDKTTSLLAKHMRWRNLSEDQFVLIKNKISQKATGNVFYATHKYCDFGQVQLVLDSDDELIGRQIFKVINAMYQKYKYLNLYSSLIFSKGNPLKPKHILGRSRDYWKGDLQSNNFRLPRHRGYSNLRTMLSDVFLLMKPESIKDEKNQFYFIISDNAIYYSAMEMSCGRVKYLPQLFVYYNTNTGINDDAVRTKYSRNRKEYSKILKHINSQKSYRCLALQLLWINDYPV